jgi:tetratricopeptide (TPR) repeat protein
MPSGADGRTSRSSSDPLPPGRRPASLETRLAAGAIVLAGLVAYFNSFGVPFLFDDLPNIEKNPSIQSLWSLDVLMPPPSAAGTVGRPLVNLSLAFNYALGGLNAGGYHVFNLIVHVLAGLALFGLVRRTLALPRFATLIDGAPPGGAGPGHATGIAAAIAMLWVVHPLQTESVVGVIQRTELLVGLFYLLTFYCFVRSQDAAVPRRWQVAVIGSALLGTASKEVMATAPVLLFLFDGLFVAGTFRAAWQQRRGLYLGLLATWIVLAILMAGSGQRSGTVGFGLGMTSWEYLLTQCRGIVIYLKRVFWPHPLVLDYGYPAVRSLLPVLPQALLLTGLALATAWAVWRRHALGFAGAWFFIILGPSSSLVPLTTQTIAEHRMYLPLLAIIAPVVIGLHRWIGRPGLIVSGALAGVLTVVTINRNQDYRSALAIWADTAAKAPDNARAHTNWGNALVRLGQRDAAIARYLEAIRLDPGYAEARHNLGLALLQAGRPEESIEPFTEALRLRPDDADGHRNFGRALAMIGRMPEALVHFQEAARLEPGHAEGLGFLGWALLTSNRATEAIPPLEKALGMEPNSLNLRVDLANALVQVSRFADALTHYEAAARLQPDDAGVHYNWGVALMQAGRRSDAVARFETVVRLKPDDAEARDTLARARREAGMSP